jgi:hypothetical protein
MKKRFFIAIEMIVLLFLLSPDLIAQYHVSRMQQDTIENEVRNRFTSVVNLATNGPHESYRAIFIDTAKVQTEYSMYDDPQKVDSICKPAISAYGSNKVQVVENKIDVVYSNYVLQKIKVVTIDIDTTHGIPIPNHTPAPKHMDIEIEWVLENSSWYIRNLNRYLRR